VTLAPGVDGLLITLPALAARFLALALLAVALRAPPARASGALSHPERWWRVARPTALWLSCLTLVGLPLTPAFAGRWAQTALVTRTAGSGPGFLLVATVALGAWVIFRRAPKTGDAPIEGGPTGWGEVGLGLILLSLAVLLGLFPNLLTGVVGGLLGL
jgi:hypothetical protein